jgi:hemolysin activation/secretion protein
MTKYFLPVLLSLALLQATAQEQKSPVYAEVGLGVGQTLMFGNTMDNLNAALGGTFTPGIGTNLIAGFYAAPVNWRGFGLGARIKGTIGSGVKGKTDADDYIYNYYNLGIHAKYHFFKTFNKGLFARAGVGFGQMTTKRANDLEKRYVHQYAIGAVGTAAIGYTFWFTNMGLTVESEIESGNRNGTVDKISDGVQFSSGQIGINTLITF